MKRLLILLVTSLALCSCIPAVIGAGTGALSAAQERRVGDAVSDSKIWTQIKNAFFKADLDRIFTPIDVKVSEGRVLLNGTAPDVEARMEAIKLAWTVNGVKEVINEINVKNSKNKFSLKQFAVDSFITSQIKSKMLVKKNLRSINYTIDTINGIVYIMGIAQHHEELEIVTEIARKIKGVKKVKNYARVKDHDLRRKNG